MNKQSLGALVVLNLLLLVALTVVTLSPEPANAQARGRGEYLMIAGEVAGRQDIKVIYILEMKELKLAAVTFSSRNDKLELIDGKALIQDMDGPPAKR